MNNAYLFEGLEGGAASLAAIARRIPAAKWDIPTGEGRFTPREVVAHLADWEPRLRGRVEAALRESGALIEVWDEGELAIENRYDQSDYLEELGRFQTERSKTIALLRELQKEDFEKRFEHPERGLLTIEDQAAFFMGHDLYHCRQLSALI